MKPIKPSGDFLESLLSTFLQDITSAQDESNRFSAALALQYSDPAESTHPKRPDFMRFFPVPVPVIKSFEFTLQFAFQGFENYVDNTLFGELKGTINQFLTDNNQPVKPGDSETITHLIFEDVKAELIRLVLNTTQKSEVIHQFAGYLQKKIVEALKKYYQGLKADSPVNLKNIRTSLEKALADFNKPLTDWGEAFNNVKMVYDVSKLNRLNSDVLCSLKVNVEMQNLQIGFDEIIPTGDESNSQKRNIRLI